MRNFGVASLLLAALCTSLSASSIVGDFTDVNPNGSWTYGWSNVLGGTFNQYPDCSSPTSCSDSGGYSENYIQWTTSSGFPYVWENISGSDIIYGTAYHPVGWLIMHPDELGDYSVVRYTVPAAGGYTISGAFEGLDSSGPTTTDVHVLLNNSSLFDAAVSAYYTNPGGYRPFSITQDFSAGDNVDFAVGYGTDGFYDFDSTGLQGDIAPGVPEPSAFVVTTAGLALFSWLRRRRSRAGFRAE